MDLDLLKDLINEELQEANKKFPLFQTVHEAYGVMREELEEASEEFRDIKEGILVSYWKLARNSKYMLDNKRATDKLLCKLNQSIIHNIKELIQLGAMVEKARILNDKILDDKE